MRSALERGEAGGLQHDRVAGRQRRRDLPDRHQEREVPGDDLPADADRLAVDEVVGEGRKGDLRHRFERLEVGQLGEMAEVQQPDGNVHQVRLAPRAAAVVHLQVGQLLFVLLKRVDNLVQDAGAFAGGHLRPRPLIEGQAGRANGIAGVFSIRLDDVCQNLAGGRVVDRFVLLGVAGSPLAADVEIVVRGAVRLFVCHHVPPPSDACASLDDAMRYEHSIHPRSGRVNCFAGQDLQLEARSARSRGNGRLRRPRSSRIIRYASTIVIRLRG